MGASFGAASSAAAPLAGASWGETVTARVGDRLKYLLLQRAGRIRQHVGGRRQLAQLIGNGWITSGRKGKHSYIVTKVSYLSGMGHGKHTTLSYQALALPANSADRPTAGWCDTSHPYWRRKPSGCRNSAAAQRSAQTIKIKEFIMYTSPTIRRSALLTIQNFQLSSVRCRT